MREVLSVSGVVSGYHGSTVLHGIDLTVHEGEVVALLGRNGVGKTTLITTIMRLLPMTAGSITVDGRDHSSRRTEALARAGVALVPQGRRLFPPLTVAEHLAVAGRGRRGEWTRDTVLDLLPALRARMSHRGDELSGGEAQMLAIARALLQNPRLLLMDEPSDGLAPAVVAQVGSTVRAVCDSGMAVLLVEQDLRLAFSVAHRVAVMAKGRIVLDTTIDDFRADPARAKELLGVG